MPLLNNKIVIIGNPKSVFPFAVGKQFRKLGYDVIIISRKKYFDRGVVEDFNVIASIENESFYLKVLLYLLEYCLRKLEVILTWVNKKRIEAVMDVIKDYRPSITNAIIEGISISRTISKINPYIVYGQQSFTYGPATAWSKCKVKVLMPWGGDIYIDSHTSRLAKYLVTYSFRRADLINPSAVSAGNYISRTFGITKDKILNTSWGTGLDEIKEVLQNESRENIKLENCIPNTAKVVMNVRRFKEGWGASTVLETFIQIARKNLDTFFILLGGPNTDKEIDAALAVIRSNNLCEKRFLFKRGEISLTEVGRLMYVSDIFVSLMKKNDMRSASIIGATMAGSVPILCDQEEYREMEKEGYKALFVNDDNVRQVVEACERYLSDGNLVSQTLHSNKVFLETYQDPERNTLRLLEKILSIAKISK